MKKLITATLLTLAAATANAVPPAPSNVVLMAGGVQFTPKLFTDAANGGGNFQESFDFVQWWEDQSGNKVSLDQIKNDVLAIGADAALSTLKALNPVTFSYKIAPTETYAGFIAEDVPEMVATSDRKGLAAMDIVAVLTKVLQQQQAVIENLQGRLSQLEDK